MDSTQTLRLGLALYKLGRLNEAIATLEQALRLQPDCPMAQWKLGNALQQLGDFAGAEKAYRVVLRDHPELAETYWQLAHLLQGKLPDADCAALEQCLARAGLSDAERCRLLFGLAQVCDAKGEYAVAATHLRQANALKLAVGRQKGQAYDHGTHERFVETILAVFTPAYFTHVRGFGLPTERPVFIVGLPRSGTTLTEQILAAHSQVFAAGELPLGRQSYLALDEQCGFTPPSGLQQGAVRHVAERHLEALEQLNRTAARVVDKMPDNYFYLGLLATLFPKAKFIHCRRDLRDVAVSCWMTYFGDVRWCNHPEHMVARFRQYRRLMEHWRAVLPVSVLEVNYEETVADLLGVARRLVEWCGLDWEPACLNFHESGRPVRTSSAVQVRQPIFARSVGRWLNYERDLGPMFDALKS
jgi:tetratricopeptide (TPR) repeat protein